MCWCYNISKNKAWELQFDRFPSGPPMEFTIEYTTTGDHCGFEIRIQLFSLYFHFKIYDKRHWDYDNHKFINGDDDGN